MISKEEYIPVLAVRDMVLYPYMYLPLFIGRSKSIKAVQAATGKPKSIILVTQKQDILQEYPSTKELYDVGVLTHITQESVLPDGSIKIFIESKERVRLDSVVDQGSLLLARHTVLDSQPIEDKTKVRNYIELILNKIYRVVKLHDDFMPDKFALLKEIFSCSKSLLVLSKLFCSLWHLFMKASLSFINFFLSLVIASTLF